MFLLLAAFSLLMICLFRAAALLELELEPELEPEPAVEPELEVDPDFEGVTIVLVTADSVVSSESAESPSTSAQSGSSTFAGSEQSTATPTLSLNQQIASTAQTNSIF